MKAHLRTVWAIYTKDMRLELRSRETINTIFIFSIVVAFIFNFTFDPSPQIIIKVAPGMIWVAYVFTSVLGMNRSLIMEKDQSTLEGLMLAPVSRDAIYAGKLLSNFTILLLVELFMIPIFVVLYDVPLFNGWFVVTLILATLGFAAVGTTFAAIAVNTRAREVMLPLLFLPVIVPVVIGSVASTIVVVEGAGWPELQKWLGLLLAFDIIFLVISSLGFEYVLEE